MRGKLADNIRALRKARGLTQEQLAEALGVTVGAVYKWETGRSAPEVALLMELADLFSVSVDVVLGYEVRDNSVEAVRERVRALTRAKDYAAASAEAEKALSRYPNDFQLVHRCGELYMFKGMETGEGKALERAIGLLSHAILLLSQNGDPEISEAGIRSDIAHCHILLDRTDEGLDILKRYNVGGMNSGLIGRVYASKEQYRPEEAAPFLMRAYGDCVSELMNTISGYFHYYVKIKDHERALDALLWLAGYMESIKISDETSAYVDKIRASLFAQCAPMHHLLGREREARAYLQKAHELARRFDSAPVHGLGGMRFCIGDVSGAAVYDPFGETAMDAVERLMLDDIWPEELKILWEELKGENN